MSPGEAAGGADVVILAVPWQAMQGRWRSSGTSTGPWWSTSRFRTAAHDQDGQFFLVECIGGQVEPYPYYDGEEIDWDWDLDRSEGLQPDVDRYVALCERARAITADLDPYTTIVIRRSVDVRWVMLGQIREYARHNGHANIIRELIDGTTGE